MLRPILSAEKNAGAGTAWDTAAPLRVLSVILSLFFALAILYGLFLFFYFLLRRSYRALRRAEKLERLAAQERRSPKSSPQGRTDETAEDDAQETEQCADSGGGDGARERESREEGDFSEKTGEPGDKAK